MNQSKEAKLVSELGGPGHSIGWGFTQDQAIQLAIAHQLSRLNGLLASGCALIETVAGTALAQWAEAERNRDSDRYREADETGTGSVPEGDRARAEGIAHPLPKEPL